MATLACRLTKLGRAQPGHGAIKGAKFDQSRLTLSTRYAVHRQTDTFTDNKGNLKARRSNISKSYHAIEIHCRQVPAYEA